MISSDTEDPEIVEPGDEDEGAAEQRDEAPRNVRVFRWIVRHLSAKNQKAAIVGAATVGHVNIAGKTEPLTRFEIKPPLSLPECALLANQIDDAAREDAEALGGHQRYKVQLSSRRTTAPSSALAALNFRVDADGADQPSDEAMTEPPGAMGMVAQAMRHSEAYARNQIAAFGTSLTSLQRTINRQSEMLEKLLAERMAMATKLEELQSARHDRELEIRKLEFQQKVQGDIFDQMKLLGPIIVNKLAGKKILPEKRSPEHALVEEFLGSLTREQVIERLLPALDVDQRIAFLALYETTREGKYDPKLLRAFMGTIRGDQVEKLRAVLSPTQVIAIFHLYEIASKAPEAEAPKNGASAGAAKQATEAKA